MSKTPEQLAEEQAAKDAEAAREAKFAEAEERARKAEEAKARAEAERDAFQQGVTAANAQKSTETRPWTDEEWTAYEERTGLSRKQTEALAQLNAAQQAEAEKKIESRIAAAEKKAIEAEERLKRFETKSGSDSIKNDYLGARPNLARYKSDFDEFLSKFPDEQKQDPKAYKDLLSLAETYVKGKVGEKAMNQKPVGSASVGGFGGGGENHGNPADKQEEGQAIDASGFQPYEQQTVRKLNALMGDKERMKAFNESPATLGPGVAYSGEKEWAENQPARGR